MPSEQFPGRLHIGPAYRDNYSSPVLDVIAPEPLIGSVTIMYEVAPPAGAGLIGGGVLASTGSEVIGIVVAAVGLLIAGLFLMRVQIMRRKRLAKHP
jgi:hypothetical protein